jgi:hypothetical protein
MMYGKMLLSKNLLGIFESSFEKEKAALTAIIKSGCFDFNAMIKPSGSFRNDVTHLPHKVLEQNFLI